MGRAASAQGIAGQLLRTLAPGSQSTVHPGADGRLVQGCHEKFDQGALFTKAVRRELEPVWAADTQRRLLAMGLVPPSLIESITTASQGATL